MIPFIAAGIGLTAAYKLKPSCSVCNSKLTWNQDCLFDGKPVCGNCGEEMGAVEYGGVTISSGGRCCKAHLESYSDELTQKRNVIAKERLVRAESVKVKTWPKAYKGDVPPPKLGKRVTTEKYNDKDEALTQLKMLAVLAGCSHVQQVEQHNSTEEDGNFKYSVWEASGVI